MNKPKFPVYGMADRISEVFYMDGMNPSKASKLTGLSVNNIYALIHGRGNPTAKTLFIIASKMNVSVDWLMGLSNEMRLK